MILGSCLCLWPVEVFCSCLNIWLNPPLPLMHFSTLLARGGLGGRRGPLAHAQGAPPACTSYFHHCVCAFLCTAELNYTDVSFMKTVQMWCAPPWDAAQLHCTNLWTWKKSPVRSIKVSTGLPRHPQAGSTDQPPSTRWSTSSLDYLDLQESKTCFLPVSVFGGQLDQGDCWAGQGCYGHAS